ELTFEELRVDPRPLLALAESVDGLAQPPRIPDQQGARTAQDDEIPRMRLRTEAINRLFTAYVDALLPTTGIDAAGAWAATPGTPTAGSTGCYGYKGPEPAAHVAAHIAHNAIDGAHTLDA